MNKAVFLDRDGTITKATKLVTKANELEIEDYAAEGLRLLQNQGFKLVVITNQPQIARGWVSEEDVAKINDKMVQDLKKIGINIDAVYFCPHHPEMHDDVPDYALKYRITCDCRKPEAGMIKQAAKDLSIDLSSSFKIGDRTVDVASGKKAGCKTILVKTGAAGKDGKYDVKADYEVQNLLEAAKVITGQKPKIMALVLAGGKGTRLMPLTKDIPKPMIDIGGKPALEHHMELIKHHNLSDVVMCISHMADKIEKHFGSDFIGLKISYPAEPQPLGSGGAIKNASRYIDADHFVVLNGDVMTNIDITSLMDFHLKNNALATMVVRHSDHPKDSDVVEIENNRITKFIGRGQVEKDIGNTGIMIFNRKILDHIPEGSSNIEKDVVFKLIENERIYGYLSKDFIKDFGTPERLESVRRRFQ